jgi:amidase
VAETLVGRSAVELAAMVRSGTVGPIEVVDAHLDRIEAWEPLLRAFTVVRWRRARAEAETLNADPELRRMPLAGVPVAIKDTVDVAGEPTRRGSLATPHTAAAGDDELVRRLRAAGCVVIGKTTLPELAIWPFTESRVSGATRNPWDPARTPGGSSGGSAVAVTAGMAPIALGSDGGGSIRIPAACCGLVGLKPGRGILSTRPPEQATPWFGLSEAGPLASTVTDAALMLDVLAGCERYRNPVAPDRPLRIALATRAPVRGIRVAACPLAAADSVAELLTAAGHEVRRAQPPFSTALFWTFLQRWLAGVAEEAGRYEPEGLEPRTRRQAFLGRRLTRLGLPRPADAEAWRRRVTAWFRAGDFDALLTPALAKPPVVVGRWEGKGFTRTLIGSTAFVPFTAPWNLAGFPSLALPAHPLTNGLPVGALLSAPAGGEGLLLGLAAQLEQARPWPRHAPPPI